MRLLGFAVHDAPGEAEAECALLQKHGIVDAVLSEDVDTIMFGCTKTLKNWSAESRSAKTPTHVTMYDVEEIKKAELGLDREGMVLVALMSGGDYLPDGIPGCGVKVACEAAKAGYGKSICRLKTSDEAGIEAWRKNLIHELYTNESGHFRVKHKALTIPEDFPNMEVLRYYTHPVVSKSADLDAVRQKFEKRRDVNLEELREFTRETFDWDYRIGAIKFIRVLGQALLSRKMLLDAAAAEKHVTKISGRRTHASTDATPELRLSFVPADVVPIDLSAEVDEVISAGREGLALNSDDEVEGPDEEVELAAKNGSGKVFDVTKPDLAWVLEGFTRRALPNAVAAWDAGERAKALRKSPSKKKATKSTTTRSKQKDAAGTQKGAMDNFVKTTKSTTATSTSTAKPLAKPVAPVTISSSPPKPRRPAIARPRTPPPIEPSKQTTPSTAGSTARFRYDWSIGSSHDSSPRTPPRPVGSQATHRQAAGYAAEAILISSSPPCDALPALPSPTSRSGGSAGGEMPGSVRALLAGGRAAEEVTTRSRQTTTTITSSTLGSSGRSRGEKMVQARLFQSSLDSYATRRDRDVALAIGSSSPFPEIPPPRTQREAVTIIDSSSPLRAVAEPVLPLPPIKRLHHSPAPQKKRLLVPRHSGAGFFDMVEVDADELDERALSEAKRLEARGSRAKVMRWSDVSEVDLTGEV